MRPRHVFQLVLCAFILYVAVAGGNGLLRAGAVIAGLYLVSSLVSESRGTQRQVWTELEIECKTGRLLDHPAYSAVEPAVIAEINRREETTSVMRYVVWEETWSCIFFGPAESTDIPVWLARSGRLLKADGTIVFERVWREVLAGNSASESEPYLVVQLGTDKDSKEIYRFYLKHLGGPKQQPVILGSLPVAILADPFSGGAQDGEAIKKYDEKCNRLAEEFGWKRVENEADHFEDDFGEFQMTYSEGEGFRVFENSFFKVRVRHIFFGA